MMGHTHALIGAAAALGIATAAHADANTTYLLVAAGGLAALVPDIDHPRAPLRRKLGLVGNIALSRLKHRGITHTLLALVAVGAAAMTALPPLFGVVVTVGYLSHLLSDMLTVSGLPVFWPYRDDNYHIIPKRLCITTNTFPEYVLGLGLLALVGSQFRHFIH